MSTLVSTVRDAIAPADEILRMEALRVETTAGKILVHDVDLYLQRGEVLGLIGESGAGKSTIGLAALVYARAGCRITGGRILLAGRDFAAWMPPVVGPFAAHGWRMSRKAPLPPSTLQSRSWLK
jgi:ABC-type dipeptide/oligopeptide/nickel transport system ATPase component